MKVLSLFDGISCGMVALERANIEIEQKDKNSYINIGNLLQIAKPLTTYLKQETFAFSFNAKEQLQNLEYQTLVEGKVLLDLPNKTAKLSLKVLGDYAHIYFIDKKLEVNYDYDIFENTLHCHFRYTSVLTSSFGCRGE